MLCIYFEIGTGVFVLHLVTLSIVGPNSIDTDLPNMSLEQGKPKAFGEKTVPVPLYPS
jgi:hypothetical protein